MRKYILIIFFYFSGWENLWMTYFIYRKKCVSLFAEKIYMSMYFLGSVICNNILWRNKIVEPVTL